MKSLHKDRKASVHRPPAAFDFDADNAFASDQDKIDLILGIAPIIQLETHHAGFQDVDGLLNADPKRFKETVKIPHISYSEAIELAFYGASIIHPKTIKPLQNKNIRLNVQSFVHPDMEPSVIDGNPSPITHHPSSITHHIVKDNQTLVSISPRDFSFMNEHNLKTVFEVCDELRIHANMMQTSALMLSLCFDHDDAKREALMESLNKSFSIKYNENLQLYTIRHYEEGQEKAFIAGRKIYLEQRSRATAQFVIGE